MDDGIDLGQVGDDLFDTIEILRTKFDVELSGFQEDIYSPGELDDDSCLFMLRRWLPNHVTQRFLKYRPISLKMIDDALRAKRWTDMPDGSLKFVACGEKKDGS